MYQIKCDGNILYDPRDAELTLLNPKCKLEVNKVGEGSFTILSNHRYYNQLHKLKSKFEIIQDDDVIFRGRMTDDSKDFYNRLDVDMEGVLAFANDSIIPPFAFPGDFAGAASSENVVEYFLNWILEQHNAQVEPWQQLKLGVVTVSDPNNYITRESKDYASTWDTLKSKLFDSALGGYLCIRYEADGNYVDYLEKFTQNNEQKITFGKNLLDLTSETDATETYSAILPIGAEVEDASGNKSIVTLEKLPDGNLTDDLVKQGKFIYSKSAVKEYGWRCVPVSKSKWDDVTEAANLRTKAMDHLTGSAMLLSNTITFKALDLGFTDEEIQSFKIYRNILADSPKHNLAEASYPLTVLDIDILNPQNIKITIGSTVRTLIDINNQNQSSTANKVDNISGGIASTVKNEVMASVDEKWVNQKEALVQTCTDLIAEALIDCVTDEEFEAFKASVTADLQAIFAKIEDGQGVVVSIPENSDINDYLTAGNYAVTSNAIAATVLNLPVNTAGKLDVSNAIGTDEGTWTYRRQKFTPYRTNVPIYERHLTRNAEGVWSYGDWIPTTLHGNKILWSGTSQITDTDSIILSEKVSQQPTGIVLTFSKHTDGVAVDNNFNHFFVPKWFVENKAGYGSAFTMMDINFGKICHKYLYINDATISGHENNDATGTGASGITYANNAFVLRYVTGV